MKLTSYDELKDKYFGPVGSPERTQYEFELSLELLAEQLKQLRKENKLTQSQLGEKIGVRKSQISKLENNAANVTVATMLKLFQALHATVILKVDKAAPTLEREDN